jgi:hypothetical protein
MTAVLQWILVLNFLLLFFRFEHHSNFPYEPLFWGLIKGTAMSATVVATGASYRFNVARVPSLAFNAA